MHLYIEQDMHYIRLTRQYINKNDSVAMREKGNKSNSTIPSSSSTKLSLTAILVEMNYYGNNIKDHEISSIL